MDNLLILLPLLLFCCVTPFSCDESVENQEIKINKTDFKKELPVQHERVLFRELTSCALARETACFFEASEEYLLAKRQDVLAQADLEVIRMHGGRAETTETPSQLAQTLSKIMSEITNLFQDSISGWLKSARESDDEDEIQDSQEIEETNKTDVEKSRGRAVSEGRKKKKKEKKEKLKLLIKLLILGIVMAVKFLLFLKAATVAIKFKFFLVALGALLLKAAQFYYEIKKGKDAQKVIYYEHAQHQHHYEGGDEDWEHSAPDHGGGGGYWGRAYDEEEGAHNLAYAKQKPGAYSKVENKNNGFSSWF